MRVPDELKISVCFLCGKRKNPSYEILGTGFFVSVTLPSKPEVGYLYLVTAKHIIDRAKRKKYRGFYLRINTDAGGVDFVKVPDRWIYPKAPPSDFAIPDVAVMPIYDYEVDNHLSLAAMPIQMALRDEAALQAHGVGIGDDVHLIGLFRHRYGLTRNIPIVRGGLIAAMPEEPLEDERGKLFDGYLIEIRSISGLSGSPVIVFKQELDSTVLRPLGKRQALPITFTNGYLLGLVRSHWSAKDVEMADAAMDDDDEPLNTGIAIVTPIKEVVNIINCDELIKDRVRLDEMQRRNSAKVSD
jgi:hypothetical protein